MNTDYQSCSETTKNIYENKKVRIATVVIENPSGVQPTNSARLNFMKNIISQFHSSDIILFPGGYFEFKKQNRLKFNELFRKVSSTLEETESSCVICFGIDCDSGRDQLAVAVNKAGTLAIGRKFYPTSGEKGYIRKADSYDSSEMGYPRVFELKNKRIYLAVCYDTFGIRHCSLPMSDIDAVLVMAHQFWKRGEGPSGDVDFARKGFAGASRQWMCPVFGTAVFFCRSIPENWPTCVLWTDKNEDIRYFRYNKNELSYDDYLRINSKKENALIYKYTID